MVQAWHGEIAGPVAAGLSEIEAGFAAQIATAVWLGRMTDAAAREALLSFALARHRGRRAISARLETALVAEYRLCRERLDLAS